MSETINSSGPYARRARTSTVLLCGVITICAGVLACQSPSPSPPQRYAVKGRVVSIDPQRRSVTLAHEEIPGYMSAMTMPFVLKDEWGYSVLAVGDHVQATLVVADDGFWLEEVTITKDDTAAGTAPAESIPGLGAQPGDVVPNFSLVNQDAESIQFAQYRGKALVLTFIYTRCPLPDFCPLMVSGFAQIQQALQEHTTLSARTHLLCISVDHAFDTPAVLRSYGSRYTDPTTSAPFAGWEFATGSAQEVHAVTRFFGLTYAPAPDQITHALRTAVITPEGKVFTVYRGNQWTAAAVVRDLQSVLEQG